MDKAVKDGVKLSLFEEIKGLEHSLAGLKALRAGLLVKAHQYTDGNAWGLLAECAEDLDTTEQQIQQIQEQIKEVHVTLDRLDEVLAECDPAEELTRRNSQHFLHVRVADGITGKLGLWESANGNLVMQLTNEMAGDMPTITGVYLQVDEVARLQEFLGLYIRSKTVVA